VESLAPGLSAELPAVDSSASNVDSIAEKIAAEIAKLSKSSEAIPTDVPLLYSGLNSITVVRLYMWLQSEYEYAEEMTHLFDEEVTAVVLASEIMSEENMDESDVDILAEEIAVEITKLSKSAEAIPKDMPLLYSGLNSITMVRLHMWLQSEHEYEEEMSHLFDEEVTAQVLAGEILGYNAEDQDDDGESSAETVVEDGASEIEVLEKDDDLAAQDITEFIFHSEEDGARQPVDEDGAPQIIVVNGSDSDHEADDEDSEDESQVIVTYRPPTSPLPCLMSPSRCAFPFNDVPESPFSHMFSSWITPLSGHERRPLLDSVLMLVA